MIKNMLYTDAVNPIRLWSPLDVNALLDAKERLMRTVQTSVAKASLLVLLKILSVACIFVGITIGWYFLIGTLIYGPEVREGLKLKIDC